VPPKASSASSASSACYAAPSLRRLLSFDQCTDGLERLRHKLIVKRRPSPERQHFGVTTELADDVGFLPSEGPLEESTVVSHGAVELIEGHRHAAEAPSCDVEALVSPTLGQVIVGPFALDQNLTLTTGSDDLPLRPHTRHVTLQEQHQALLDRVWSPPPRARPVSETNDSQLSAAVRGTPQRPFHPKAEEILQDFAHATDDDDIGLAGELLQLGVEVRGSCL
jgi:hypothetical protein